MKECYMEIKFQIDTINKIHMESGYEIKIKRDIYGRRVHHTNKNYKKDQEVFMIDSIWSRPRYTVCKERGLKMQSI